MEHKQEDFMYKRMGPWPQPNPVLPFDEFPAVIHIPKKELRHFFWNIELRYMWQAVTYMPTAMWYAFKNRGIAKISDEEFADFLCVRSFSKFLTPIESNKISRFLPGIDPDIIEKDKKYYISDFWLMATLKPQNDKLHSAATVCLFEATSDKDKYTPIANYIVPYGQDTGTVITPQDHEAWELAKAYTLLGCSNRLVLAVHSMLHFPMDTVNSISKSVLPKENLLLKLLLPHFEFSLELDLTVLTSWTSPIKNHWEMPYTGLTGNEYSIAQLFVSAYMGIKDREETYPPYTFSLQPRLPDTNYGEFQAVYYECIERFAKKVLSHLSDDDKFYIKKWADYIDRWLNTNPDVDKGDSSYKFNHFPTGDELFEQFDDGFTVLEKLAAKIIWDVTVGHAADHYDYAAMDMHQIPFRLRTPPPESKQAPHFERKNMRTIVDTFKHRMCWKMFFSANNVNLLCDTDYGFTDPVMQQYNKEFLDDLQRTEDSLESKGIRNFIPLKKVSRTIQY